MIAVDTNVLVYAHREDSPWHDAALTKITELAEARAPWAVPWPCLHEFLAIVTHPRLYSPPTPLAAAINQIEAWLESPSLVFLEDQGEDRPPQREGVFPTKSPSHGARWPKSELR
jgi:predicted nucleic acid-binding protein